MAAAIAAGGGTPVEASVIVHDPSDVTISSGGAVFFRMQTGAVSTNTIPSAQFVLFRAGYALFGGAAGTSTGLLGSTSGGFGLAYRLGNSASIGPSASAFAPLALLAGLLPGGTAYGNWLPAGRGFLGLRFLIGGSPHFGWADITVYPDLSLTFHRFAYEDVADQPIYASPEPHPVALVALGAAGLAAFRRCRMAREQETGFSRS
jgi:hypothetical protein